MGNKFCQLTGKQKTKSDMSKNGVVNSRFDYIDHFRGFVIVLMLLDHSSYYLNSIWAQSDPLDPLFPTWGQFVIRYIPYICAPGFLMMSGAMVWWSFQKRVAKGVPVMKVKWHIIQRALFLILIQVTWINASWGGFTAFKPDHLGVVATIGISMILLTPIIQLKWQYRTVIALAIFIIHAFLIEISYNTEVVWQEVLMQTFIDAGNFNKYPVLPWFALAILGSVMATGWLDIWKTDKQKIFYGLAISLPVFAAAILLRLNTDFGSIFPFLKFSHFSFFMDQKYPPSLFMNLFSFAAVVFGVTVFIAIGRVAPWLLSIFSIPGKVSLFFYGMHIAIFGVFIKRLDIFYREGDVMESLIGFVVMMLVMWPLCWWFYGVKRRSNNVLIQMI
ncbi:MAG: heparan-alpha-glucosaminide N-acetyltransferase domain-containing protein [Bacteroidales bacterium]|nr:heparan-alpha-glucosaminide N-acetyltransferase domain-containing protein [Bacteroidales bacterium]